MYTSESLVNGAMGVVIAIPSSSELCSILVQFDGSAYKSKGSAHGAHCHTVEVKPKTLHSECKVFDKSRFFTLHREP